MGRCFIGGKFQQMIRQIQFALGDCQSNGRCIEALADRIQYMRLFRRLGFPPASGDHLTVPQDHEAVFGVYFIKHFNKFKNRLRRNALGLRSAAWQRLTSLVVGLNVAGKHVFKVQRRSQPDVGRRRSDLALIIARVSHCHGWHPQSGNRLRRKTSVAEQ